MFRKFGKAWARYKASYRAGYVTFMALFFALSMACLRMRDISLPWSFPAWMVPGLWWFTGWACNGDLRPAEKPFIRRAGVWLNGMALCVQWITGDWRGVWFSLISVCLFLWMLREVRLASSGDLAKPPATHGSAEWETLEGLRANGRLSGKGFMLGSVRDLLCPFALFYNGDRHMLTIAPNRSGKGTCAIIPNLLSYRGSVMVIDPKGENAMITAQCRRDFGQDVHIVDPWAITGEPVSCFNPLDLLEAGDIDIAENAMMLADALVANDGKSDPFWHEEAKALLQGLILYVATDAREADTRHLARVRDLLLLDGDDMPALFQRMTESLHHVVASTGARGLQKEEKLLGSVLASAQANTHFLDSPRLRESLSRSDFKFEDLKATKMSVYLVLPADRLDGFGRWLRLLIQQALTVNARNIHIQPEKPILFVLDELPALGKLAMVEKAFGLMAGYGMQLWAIAQDVSQLKRVYGDSWETFIANAGAIQYFGGRDLVTAKYFSELCGMATVWNLSSSTSYSTSYSKEGSSSTSGTNYSRATVQRKLAFPDELMRLNSSSQLVFIENHAPIIAGRKPWFEDARLSLRGRNLRPPVCPVTLLIEGLPS